MSAGADLRWVGAAPQIVFEDAQLRVMFQPGGSDMLLMTFGNAGNLADGTRFFADGLVGKFGMNCLGFMPRAANWYPAASMRAAARELAYTLGAFAIRMAYGSSLGAYGAIKYTRLLGATHVVAFAPQWSIDPAECTEDSGYADLFHPGMAGMGITSGDMAGDITVFYDPGQRHDAYHHATLARLAAEAPACAMRCCHVHHAGHYVALVLRGSVLATAIFDACLRGDVPLLYRVTNPARRASYFRRRHLLTASARLHPGLTLRAVGQMLREGQIGVLDGARCLLALHASLPPAQAAWLVRGVLPHVSKARAHLLQAGAQAPAKLLRTAHGGILSYSALGGCLTHMVAPGSPGLHPVFVHGASLAVRVGDDIHVCQGIDAHATELVCADLSLPPGCFEVLPCGPGTFHLRASGLFATAGLDGTVWRTAPRPLGWEVFTECAAA